MKPANIIQRGMLTWALALVLGSALALCTTLPTSAHAHGGEDHGDAAPAPKPSPAAPGATAGLATLDASAPQRLPDGSLWIPKSAQHRLGLLTIQVKAQAHAMAIELNGRVVADPNAGGRVQATQPGRIEPGPQGLPMLGQAVAKGQVLAYLRPAASSLEQGNQRANLADLDAQLAVAERKVARYAQLEGAVPQKDIDAARIERDALRQRRSAIGASTSAPEALIAPVAGTLAASNVVIGQVVDAKDVLFEVVDPKRLMVEALVYEPAQTQGLKDASAALPEGTLQLAFVGGGRQLRDQAMPVLFRITRTDAPVAIGQVLKVTASTSRSVNGIAVPSAALGRNASGEAIVWLHTQPLDARTVVVTSGLADGDRVVVEGASLLAQIR